MFRAAPSTAGQMVRGRSLGRPGRPFDLREAIKLALWIPVAVFISDNVVGCVSVEGASMTPTLNPGWPTSRDRDWLLLNKWHVTWRKAWQRGDIVTLWSPTSNKHMLTVKRIVAIEGDTVRTLPPYPEPTVRLGPGEVWVEGDNEDASKDSNTYGPIPMSLLHSKATRIIYPLSRQQSLSSSSNPPPHPFPATPGNVDQALALAAAAGNRVLRISSHSINGRAAGSEGRVPGGEGVGWGGKSGLGEGDSPEIELARAMKRKKVDIKSV